MRHRDPPPTDLVSADDDQRRSTAAPRLRVENQPLVELLRWAQARSSDGVAVFELDVADPDDAPGAWPGQRRPDGALQRGWRAWFDLAEGVGYRLGTPLPLGAGRVLVRFVALGAEAPWHAGAGERGDVDRYADPDGFGAVHKLEHPGFLVPLLGALELTAPPDGGRVLALGCHRGDELAALSLLEPAPGSLELVGLDASEAVLSEARRRLPEARFVHARLHRDEPDQGLPRDLGRFDLVIAVALLQSPDLDGSALLRQLVQHHLHERGALVVGLPNSRFRDGEVVWGARTRNYRAVDLSLVVRDLAAYRRYLAQHGFTTHVGGRYDLLLSAWRGARPRRSSTGVAPR